MTSRDFCFWLQGYIEMAEPTALSQRQLECVKNHLNLVFKHEIDPSMGGPKKQAELNEAHDPLPKHMRPGTDPLLRC